ncbi:MAG: 30S ribosomal protein S20 [Hydrogenoanaerobacterium sp.]
MPNIKSAKKRVKVIAAKSAENKAVRTNLKTVIKSAEAALANNSENKTEAVKLAVKKIDQAAAKNILHKNCASRKKSHLTSKLNVNA